MAYEVPDLPYDYDALEPHIDEATMQRASRQAPPGLRRQGQRGPRGHRVGRQGRRGRAQGARRLPADKQGPVRNNAGGHANHSFFWKIMSPDGGGEPSGALADAINETFGNFDSFKEKVKAAGIGQFGSGWAWLVHDGSGLSVTSTANQDSPISDGRRRCSASTSGSTPTTSSTRTSVPITWMPSGTSSTGTKSAAATTRSPEPPRRREQEPTGTRACGSSSFWGGFVPRICSTSGGRRARDRASGSRPGPAPTGVRLGSPAHRPSEEVGAGPSKINTLRGWLRRRGGRRPVPCDPPVGDATRLGSCSSRLIGGGDPDACPWLASAGWSGRRRRRSRRSGEPRARRSRG